MPAGSRVDAVALKTFSRGVNEALTIALENDPTVICYGLGVPDPKGVFGTTLGLQERFGSDRVFDMPTSESAMTGIAIGAAINGLRPVLTHQRLDFALLSMDQLVNNAAKWHYMFGSQRAVPITIRMILGRGWGQGPTHSQNLQSWFAHIPGLKVVMPASPADAKGLLLSSIFDDDPVIFLEHRWLHEMSAEVPDEDVRIPIGKAAVLREGADLTIVAMSYMTVEARHALEHLEKGGVSAELIDLRTISPIDWPTIAESIRKTGRLLVLDTSNSFCSVAGEVIARAAEELFSDLKCPPRRICLPDIPTPTSSALTERYYRRAEDVVRAAGEMTGRDVPIANLVAERTAPHDVPGAWFKGPF
jgi:acetoin:2,6-dichlorophenolindophenol oxidoreductase subunit beta